jgi:RNA polymerase sigma factor (sigma-70 family)
MKMKAIKSSSHEQTNGSVPLGPSKTSPDLSKIDEQQLWQAFKNGDEKAFSHIYKTHIQALFEFGCQFVGNRELVKDAIQSVFIETRNSKTKQEGIFSIKSYLYKSLYRKIIKMAKKESKLLSFSPKLDDEGFLVTFSHDLTIINDEGIKNKKMMVEKAINRLPARQREALLYYFYEGLTYEEIAYIMGFDQVHSARKLVYKSIQAIREAVGKPITLSSLAILILLVLWFLGK